MPSTAQPPLLRVEDVTGQQSTVLSVFKGRGHIPPERQEGEETARVCAVSHNCFFSYTGRGASLHSQCPPDYLPGPGVYHRPHECSRFPIRDIGDQHIMCAGTVRGRLYVLCGEPIIFQRSFHPSVWIYTIDADTWTQYEGPVPLVCCTWAEIIGPEPAFAAARVHLVPVGEDSAYLVEWSNECIRVCQFISEGVIMHSATGARDALVKWDYLELYKKGVSGGEDNTNLVSWFSTDEDLHLMFHSPSYPSQIRHICYSKGVWRDVPRVLTLPKMVWFRHSFQVGRTVYIIGHESEREEDCLTGIAGYDTVSGEWTDYIQTAFSCYAGVQVSPELHMLCLHSYYKEDVSRWYHCEIDVDQIHSKGGMLCSEDWGHTEERRRERKSDGDVSNFAES
ncbi:hypothetical protein KIPB_009484 [Kipferlia bialata]|uniref:Uncharacterized protein n=1 Tax=Kipferlia bialata TaxID=797122 RepID=A0A9K3D1S8_9EUKA|nr:hypothetical protein KIPB_009484 [Kipferlia bialata]|eukprot:g9484.t1